MLLDSSVSVKQKLDDVVSKIKRDYEIIEEHFSEFLTNRAMKSGLEVLEDILSFFEASVDFIAVSCEKLRKTHGNFFKLAFVKALLGLRTDLTGEERNTAFQACKDVLQSFSNLDRRISASGNEILSNLDTSAAA